MKRVLTAIFLILTGVRVQAQSVETFAGDKRAGADLMWFKSFSDTKEARTPFLFFSRNRASVDYKGSPSAFASTNAVSYNFKNGLGLVAAAVFLNAGFVPKAGIQLYKQKRDFMFFGWLVADLKKNGNADLFGLFRYQPKINETWRGFLQLELFPTYHPGSGSWNLTERTRIGGKYHRWAGGLMVDLNQAGKGQLNSTSNIGGFLRYDF